ncbi:MAG: ATP-binding protein [Candidatus Dojkabacteria bacterium]
MMYLRERNEKAYIYLALLGIVVGPIWSTACVGFLTTNTYEIGNIWIKVIYMSSIAMGLFHFLFTSNYLEKRKVNVVTYLILIIGGVILSYTILFTNYFVESIHIGEENYARVGICYYIWLIWFSYVFSGNLLHILEQYRNLSFIKKEQHKYLIVAFTLTSIGAFPTNVILPIWGVYKYIWIGPALFSISNFIVYYGLTQTKFVKTSKIIREFLRIISNYILPVMVLVYLMVNNEKLFFLLNIENDLFKYVILILLVIFLLKLIEILSKNLFISEKDILENSVKSFSYEISRKTDLEELSESTLKYISSKTSITTSKILIYDDANKKLYDFSNGEWKLKNQDKIFIEVPTYWRDAVEEIEPLVRAELEYMRNKNPLGYRNFVGILNLLEIDKIQVVYPIIAGQKIVGLLLIKDLVENSIFSSSELLLLDRIYVHFHNAVNRALLYEQLQTFNQILQARVNEQTKELQLKVEQLQEARKKERDMIDIMGHELRTPATVVKLNAEFLSRFSSEIQSDPASYQKCLKRIQDSIENEINLINTLLSSAKLEGDKIDLNLEAVDIKQEIEMAVHANESNAEGKGLQLVNKTDSNTPRVYADKSRTVEVLNNLIDNAIKYTEQGEVEVNTQFDDEFVTVNVIDTGQGIPEEDIPKLGQKFFRINNYVESSKDDKVDIIRPGGSGLGLYVAFNLIEKMNGKISVQSEVGKGSVFSFSLPRFKGEQAEKKESSKNMFERLNLVRK